MTTNINKIVRGNLTLKPWILSKNTSEIVNTCIEKIYKQVPNNFKKDLLQNKMVTPRSENKGPIRSYRAQESKERSRQQASASQITRPRLRTPVNTGENLLNAVMKSSKKGSAHNFVATKKLLKSPNYKIYSTRRFGSSASSSSASIFHRYDKQRRQRSQQAAQLNYLLRSFGTIGGNKHFGLNPAVLKYLIPERNQHMQHPIGSLPQAMEVTCGIQRDLMAIDNTLKDRISLAKNRIAKLTASGDAATTTVAAKSSEPKEPLRGWNHPNAADLFMSRLHEGGVANAHLYEQHLKLQHAPRPGAEKKASNIAANSTPKLNRVSENINKILGETRPTARNAGHHVVTKQETPLDRLPSRRFSSRKPMPSVPDMPKSAEPAGTSANTAATATSMLVAEIDSSLGVKSGRYNRINHFNRRY